MSAGRKTCELRKEGLKAVRTDKLRYIHSDARFVVNDFTTRLKIKRTYATLVVSLNSLNLGDECEHEQSGSNNHLVIQGNEYQTITAF